MDSLYDINTGCWHDRDVYAKAKKKKIITESGTNTDDTPSEGDNKHISTGQFDNLIT